MASDDVQTNIRIPAELKDRIVSVADAAGRSLSAEIAQRLEASFQFEEKLQDLQRELTNALSIADLHARQLRIAKAELGKVESRRAAARAEADSLALRLSEASAISEQLRHQAEQGQAELVKQRTRAELFEDQVGRRDKLITMISELAAMTASLQAEKGGLTKAKLAELKSAAEYFSAFASERPMNERLLAAAMAVKGDE